MVEEKPFRVLLDFSELNLNLSKYVWMNISPRELNNIADFKNAVLKKINIDRKDIRLFVHDGLLLEDEKIIILRENDTVKVQYEDSTLGRDFNSSANQLNISRYSESENYNGEEMEKVPSKQRKRKSNSIVNDVTEEFDYHSKSHKKKKKHKTSLGISPEKNMLTSNVEIFADPVINEIELANISVKSHEERERGVNESKLSENFPDNEASFEITFDSPQNSVAVQGSNCKKQKRKRHRKRKSVPQVLDTISDNAANVFSEVPQKNITSNTLADNFSTIRKHIRFTSPVHSPSITNQSTDIVDLDTYINKFKSSLPTQSRVIGTPDYALGKTFVAQNNSTPTLPNSPKNNSWNVSPMQNEYTTAIEESSVSQDKEESKLEKNSKVSYADYPILNCLPPIGTCIAYKVLELDENYSPSVSDYKEGIIRKIDATSEEIEIELVHMEIKPGRLGKFENVSRDEIPLPQVIKNVTVTWPSLIEPRCMKK